PPTLSLCFSLLSFSLTPPPPTSPLFPYTTLFRSVLVGQHQHLGRTGDHVDADLAEHQPLRRRHVGVARADDLVDRRDGGGAISRSEEHTSELQSLTNLVCRLLLEKKKKTTYNDYP